MRTLSVVLSAVLVSVAAPAIVAQQEPAEGDVASSLGCIQNALGGTAAFAAVSSLYITGEGMPPRGRPGRPPGTVEISVVFPDQFLRADRGQPFRPGEPGLSSFIGFSKGVILSRPGHPDPERARLLAQHSFAREMLMRLPRKIAGVNLTRNVINDSGQERLAIEASGPGGLRATLLVDRRTCVPIALQFNTVRGFVSGLARIELSDYRPFGGIRFPTLLRTTVAGQPQEEERVTSIEVNTPTAARAFIARQ